MNASFAGADLAGQDSDAVFRSSMKRNQPLRMTMNGQAEPKPKGADRLRLWLRIALALGLVVAICVALDEPDLGQGIYLLTLISLLALLVAVLPRLCKVKRLSIRVTQYAVLGCSLVLTLVASEIGLRTFWIDDFYAFEDERSLLYQYHRTLGWFPRPNSRHTFFGSRPIAVAHNSKGFRDTENKDPHQPGVVFLGDSFVWGYDAEAHERFTDRLQARHPELTVYNFGVSGYGTDQAFLLLQQQLKQLAPRAVVLIFCSENDEQDNCWNAVNGGYYKPYFTCESNGLRLNGVPVPRAERVFRASHPALSSSQLFCLSVAAYFKYFAPKPEKHANPTSKILLEMQRYLQQRGILFAVGFTSTSSNLQAVLEAARVPYLDLTTTNRYLGGGQHWTPAGHEFVCGKLEQFLLGMPGFADLVREPKRAVGEGSGR